MCTVLYKHSLSQDLIHNGDPTLVFILPGIEVCVVADRKQDVSTDTKQSSSRCCCCVWCCSTGRGCSPPYIHSPEHQQESFWLQVTVLGWDTEATHRPHAHTHTVKDCKWSFEWSFLTHVAVIFSWRVTVKRCMLLCRWRIRIAGVTMHFSHFLGTDLSQCWSNNW